MRTWKLVMLLLHRVAWPTDQDFERVLPSHGFKVQAKVRALLHACRSHRKFFHLGCTANVKG